MILITEKGKIPVYEVECSECHSKLHYLRRDINNNSIICPCCNRTITFNTPHVKVEEIESEDYICTDVGDVLGDLIDKFKDLAERHYGPTHFRVVDDYARGIADCQKILEETKDNWKV